MKKQYDFSKGVKGKFHIPENETEMLNKSIGSFQLPNRHRAKAGCFCYAETHTGKPLNSAAI